MDVVNRRISRCGCQHHSLHLGKRREMCFHSVSMCARFRLCQIATSAISINTPVPRALSVTSAVSQWGGETLQTPSLRNTDSWHESPRPVCGNAPYKSYMTSTTRHVCILQQCINNKHASVIFTSRQRMYMCVSFLSHIPELPLCPIESTCSTKLDVPPRKTDRVRQTRHKKGQEKDRPDDNDRIMTLEYKYLKAWIFEDEKHKQKVHRDKEKTERRVGKTRVEVGHQIYIYIY